MAIELVTGPSVEPITAAELKLQCKIGDDTSEDSLLTIIIAAARTLCENKLGRALIDQTWRLTLDEFPTTTDGEIKIPKPNVRSITSVAYIDINGDSQTLDSSVYALDAATSPGWLLPADGEEWPETDDVINAVTITFVAGYGATAATVPAPIRQWVLMTAAFMYANRESMDASGRTGEVPGRFVDGLLDAYIAYGV